MAPAGNEEAFHAAIEAGADAIYISPKILNARAYGKNFTLPQIYNLTEQAHEKGRKLFVAMNALMKEDEIPSAVRLLSSLEEMEIDALIIQDLGIWRLARRYFPGLRLHASTLMAIHNSPGAEMAREMGFSRVVLARELTLKEIAAISRNTAIELEVFIHGAMCFTISGLCLFSSYFGGRASTRGKCVQPCRRQYRWKGRSGTFFSMDDLCGLEFIPELSRLGISSLKIEGRLKPPGYVSAVTKAYKMVLDEGPTCSPDLVDQAKEILDQALGRPTSSGFFLSSNPKGAISPTRSANTGRYIGKLQAVKDDWFHISGHSPPKKGDRLRLVMPKKDWQFSSKCHQVQEIDERHFKIRLSGHIPRPPSSLAGTLLFKTDTTSTSDGMIAGSKGPLRRDRVKVRLQGAEKKANRVLADILHTTDKGQRPKTSTRPEIYLRVSRLSDVKIARGVDIKGILLEITPKNIRAVRNGSSKRFPRTDIIWTIPPVLFPGRVPMFGRQIEQLLRLGFRNFQISNISHLAFFKKKRARKRLRLSSGYQLNILNSQALMAAGEMGISSCHFSIETDIENLEKALATNTMDVIFTVFGFIPLFTSRLRHRLFNAKSPVISPRGEKFHWTTRGDIGHLFASTPYSALDLQKGLLRAGVKKWILDLNYLPGRSKLPKRLPQKTTLLGTKFRGRSFNLPTHLD